jgi:Flp pilus assembly protein TadD
MPPRVPRVRAAAGAARVALAFVLLAAFANCRDRDAPSGPATVPAVARAARPGRPVLFVGLDGADWQLLDSYVAAGRMPVLAGLVREGRSGVLTTLQPPLSPLVWTTMMTGVSPVEHGILDFTRRSPSTGALEPITSDERRVPAVWNVATWAGRAVAVFGLWATFPAEPVRGLLVADRFSSFTSRDTTPPPGVVYPAAQEEWARAALAAVEAETDLAALRAYLPDLTATELDGARTRPDPFADPVSGLLRVLVETRAYHRLAGEWIARERPALAVVYFQGTDTVGHLFAPFAPPRQPGVSEADFARYSGVPERYFAEVDRLLGEYRRLAEDAGAVLVIASDHGFHWREGRPTALSSAAAATAGRWHREEGMYLLWGPGIASAADRGRGTVGQVAATLLTLLGLPPGTGMEPPLTGISDAGDPAPALEYRAFYQPPAPAAAQAADSAADAEAVARLRALGYIGASEGRDTRADGDRSGTRTAASWNNEGLLWRGRGETARAAVAFEQALALEPGHAAALSNLSDLLAASGGDAGRADELLLAAFAAGLPDGAERIAERALAATRAGDGPRAQALLDRALSGKGTKAAAGAATSRLWLLRGRFRLEAQQCREAFGDFERAAGLAPADPVAPASAGLALLCLGDEGGAARQLRRSLDLDPAQPQLREALARLPP